VRKDCYPLSYVHECPANDRGVRLLLILLRHNEVALCDWEVGTRMPGNDVSKAERDSSIAKEQKRTCEGLEASADS
jgi:hypothetical protein